MYHLRNRERRQAQPLLCKVSLWARHTGDSGATSTAQWELIESVMLSTAIDGTQSAASSARVGRATSAQLCPRLKDGMDQGRLNGLSRLHGIVFLKGNEVYYQDTGTGLGGSTNGSEVVSPATGARRKFRWEIIRWREEDEVHLPGDFILTYKVLSEATKDTPMADGSFLSGGTQRGDADATETEIHLGAVLWWQNQLGDTPPPFSFEGLEAIAENRGFARGSEGDLKKLQERQFSVAETIPTIDAAVRAIMIMSGPGGESILRLADLRGKNGCPFPGFRGNILIDIPLTSVYGRSQDPKDGRDFLAGMQRFAAKYGDMIDSIDAELTESRRRVIIDLTHGIRIEGAPGLGGAFMFRFEKLNFDGSTAREWWDQVVERMPELNS